MTFGGNSAVAVVYTRCRMRYTSALPIVTSTVQFCVSPICWVAASSRAARYALHSNRELASTDSGGGVPSLTRSEIERARSAPVSRRPRITSRVFYWSML